MKAALDTRRKPESSARVPTSALQRAAINEALVTDVPPIVHEVLNSPGQPLDAETRTFFEPRFECDFSAVRVHTDAKAANHGQRTVPSFHNPVALRAKFAVGAQHDPCEVEADRIAEHVMTMPEPRSDSRPVNTAPSVQCEAKRHEPEERIPIVQRQAGSAASADSAINRPARPSDPATQMSRLLEVARRRARASTGWCYQAVANYIREAGGYGDILDIVNDSRMRPHASALQFAQAVDANGAEALGLEVIFGNPYYAEAGRILVLRGRADVHISAEYGDISVIDGYEGVNRVCYNDGRMILPGTGDDWQPGGRYADLVVAMYAPRPRPAQDSEEVDTSATTESPAVPDVRRSGLKGLSSEVAGESPKVAPTTVNEVIDRPGEPLDAGTRAFFEPRLGFDFSAVRVHSDATAAQSAQSINALAYTVGNDIVFGADQFKPGSADTQRLMAHELAHVLQQSSVASLGRPPLSEDPVTIRRSSSKPSVPQSPGSIAVADLVTDIEAIEQAYSDDTPEQILTRIRQQYYGKEGFSPKDAAKSLAFHSLIPDAPSYSKSLFWGPQMRLIEEGRVGKRAYGDLTAHADENGEGDNPSPYVVMPNGAQIDLGHFLLGLDALLHPRTQSPYASYGIDNVDVATWVADLGIASVWMSVHEQTGKPHSDVTEDIKGLKNREELISSPPNVDTYYNMSAPTSDLLGDIDAFGLHAQWTDTPSSDRRLSHVVQTYYLDKGKNTVQHRFEIFCNAPKNKLNYTLNGANVTWDPTLRDTLIARVDRFNDLYAAGNMNAGLVTLGKSPSKELRCWPHTGYIVDKFLKWLKAELENELRATRSSGR